MPVKLPPKPTPQAFADAWTKEVLEPAIRKLAGADGKLTANEAARGDSLTGAARLAADNTRDVFAATGVSTRASVSTLLAAGRKYAFEAAAAAAGSDGVLSKADAARLPSGLRADFNYLSNVSAPRYSENVVREVMAAHGLTDLQALLEAARVGDTNGYLNRTELEAAARSLAGAQPELGVVSDLDKTVIPAHRLGQPMPSPYPGVAQLFHELEFAREGSAGDVTYVTARSPDRTEDVDEYLADHGLPAGPIETGTSTVPWVALKEKVADISRVLEANPGQKFVLFGDSNHKDPEVYRQILDKYPGRITAVFIHKVTATVPPERVAGMHLVSNYAEAAGILHGQGVLEKAAARRVMESAKAGGLAISVQDIDRMLGG
ncbi:MAG: App1 family protein [Myxococcales bacterium]|nr:App1 family protein [Myxococcales bacterium]